MKKPRSKRTTHRTKAQPEPEVAAQPEVIAAEPMDEERARWDLLFSQAGLPEWESMPDAATLYSFAIKEMSILARLCPDLEIKYQAIQFMAREFAPGRPPRPRKNSNGARRTSKSNRS
jgi:hypothetical protein